MEEEWYMKFYVYEWFIIETKEIFYVGKGCRNRYKVRKHNKLFNSILENNNCASRIIMYFETEKNVGTKFFIEIPIIKEEQ